jgi:3'-phosphoadenosine 5'-phosphosulfate sulfotransferase (PAPS reductase)/FAD synthetase
MQLAHYQQMRNASNAAAVLTTVKMKKIYSMNYAHDKLVVTVLVGCRPTEERSRTEQQHHQQRQEREQKDDACT